MRAYIVSSTASNGFYESIVLAFYNNKWKSKAIIFDESYTRLVCVDVFRKTFFGGADYRVFTHELSDSDWTNDGKWSGYSDILEVRRQIRKGKEIAQAVVDKYLAEQKKYSFEEWIPVIDKESAERLLACSCRFHDSYISEVHIEENYKYLTFDCWGCQIILKLNKNDLTVNCEVPYGDYSDFFKNNEFIGIFDAGIFFENGFTYWTSEWGFQSEAELEKNSKVAYLKTRRLYWKFIPMLENRK